MKKFRLFRTVLKKTYADKLILIFIVFFLLDAFFIMLAEPAFCSYRDALWYCYSVFSTVGFGDIIAVTLIGRILTLALTILAILIIALVTGVIVAFYNDLVSMQYKAAKAEILDKLEHLEELPQEELREISRRIRMLH